MGAFVIEVDLRGHVLPRHHSVLGALAHIGNRIDPSKWCLVGGMMVLIALAERGRVATRSSQTKDADILLDVCTSPDVLARVVHELASYGFTPIEPFREGAAARCTFVSVGRSGQIDVLCPEDSPSEVLSSVPGVESLAIPGGRRALEVSQLVTITYDDDQRDVTMRVPLLVGAMVVKAAAALDRVTANQSRHIQDIVDMLLGLDDPTGARTELTRADQLILLALADRMSDDGDVAWDGINAEQRNLARASFGLLTT